ncbi:hypothetical protein F383_38332 [Gossypium arboreum]|uniref:Uncharacterized protein n=1 Tax=Gossypium arboreum TaxID=29729 RepID=A0A0B0MEQ3_GOSAR|nr:hypothetical protein F383_38332 [Gossypium arboreum]
MSLVSGKIHGS